MAVQCGRQSEGVDTVPDAPKSTTAGSKTKPDAAAIAPLWTGTGLCCESQGDGVPCQGTDGECENCGRALPRPVETADPSGLRIVAE